MSHGHFSLTAWGQILHKLTRDKQLHKLSQGDYRIHSVGSTFVGSSNLLKAFSDLKAVTAKGHYAYSHYTGPFQKFYSYRFFSIYTFIPKQLRVLNATESKQMNQISYPEMRKQVLLVEAYKRIDRECGLCQLVHCSK